MNRPLLIVVTLVAMVVVGAAVIVVAATRSTPALAPDRATTAPAATPREDAPTAAAASIAMPAVEFSERERSRIATLSPLPEVPPSPTNAVADDPVAAELGHRLFFEDRLSAEGTVSCATCHDPELHFADALELAFGRDELDRHTPALWNVAYNRWFFWDGRADTLWSQALIPIEVPEEHGFSRVQCAHVVYDDSPLRSLYEQIFGPMPNLANRTRFPEAGRPVPDEPDDPQHRAWSAMTDADRDAINRVFSNLGKSLEAYQRQLVSRRAPFDVFAEGLRTGDPKALAALDVPAQRGLKLFTGKANCLLCHFGPNFSDGEFHSTGVPPRGGGDLYDAARYTGIPQLQSSVFSATGPYADGTGPDLEAAREKVRSLVGSSETWGQFKTPSLRNVALTPPYMHQGQFATLADVVNHYSTLDRAVLPTHHVEQLLVPLNLTDTEVADLVAFLESLTSIDVDDRLLAAP